MSAAAQADIETLTSDATAKFSVNAGALAEAMGSVLMAVESKGSIPILSTVHIQATGGTVTLTGTNMELAIRVTVPAVVLRPGTICLNATMLAEVARRLAKDADILVDAGDAKAAVTAPRLRSTIPLLDIKNFPAVDMAWPGDGFAVEADDLIRIIKLVSPAVSTDQTQCALSGLNVFEVDGKLKFAGVSKAFVAIHSHPAPPDSVGMNAAIIPMASVKAISHAASGAVRMVTTHNRLFIRSGAVEIASKLIDAGMIEFDRIAPRDVDKLCQVSAASLDAAIDMALPFDGGMSEKKITFTLSEGHVTIATASEKGSADINLDCPGDDMTFAAQGWILQAICAGCKKTVEIRTNAAATALVCTDPDNDAVLYLAGTYKI